MPLLNQTFVKIYQKQIVPASWNRDKILKAFDLSKKPYWYVEVYDYQSFDRDTWERAIPPGILRAIQSGHITLLVNNSAEAFTDTIMPLYVLLLVQLEIKEQNLIYCTGARDIMATVDYAAELNSKQSIPVILTSEFESTIQRTERIRPTMVDIGPTDQFNRKFINLNRQWRPHRPAFVAMLTVRGLLEQGYVSLAEHADDGYAFYWDLYWDRIIQRHPDWGSLLNDHKTVIVNTTPLTVDGWDPRINPEWADQASHWMYQNSYFSIVSETNFYREENTRFLTEKTFKTVIHRHPFILITRPHTLALFKEKGYRTFAPLINEAYDLEQDDCKRMNMVLEETERLCSLGPTELREFVNGTRAVCDYNYNVLMLKTGFSQPLN